MNEFEAYELSLGAKSPPVRENLPVMSTALSGAPAARHQLVVLRLRLAKHDCQAALWAASLKRLTESA